MESGLAIVEFKNPLQMGFLQSVLRFVDEALTLLAKKTGNYKENPMRRHHVQWLDKFRGFICAVVWQVHLVLGSQMQNQVAYSTLPTMISIMENIRKLFNAHPNGETKQAPLNILEHFSTTHNEGVDPTNVHVFETSHPYPLND